MANQEDKALVKDNYISFLPQIFFSENHCDLQMVACTTLLWFWGPCKSFFYNSNLRELPYQSIKPRWTTVAFYLLNQFPLENQRRELVHIAVSNDAELFCVEMFSSVFLLHCLTVTTAC